MSENTPEQVSETPTASQPGNLSELPQWGRDSISKANNEAAKYRTELRTVTDQHTAALTQIQALSDEKAAAEAARNAIQHQLMKLNVALSVGVPGDKAADFAARLQGTTEDEYREDAAKAMSLFGSTQTTPAATDPSQGFGNDIPVVNTPEAAFAELLRSQIASLNR